MTSFSTGMQHMQAAIDEGKKRAEQARQGGGGGKQLHYFNWKPGDVKVLRFLTDDVITEDFAEFIVDKTGNTKSFLIPASDPHILDRYRSPSPGIGWRKEFKSGRLVEPKTRKIGVGIAVLRDEQPGESGKLELRDYVYDQEIEGVNYLSRYFGLVQQSVSNFWHTLAVSCFKRYGTICDRDYQITRTGEGLDTKYDILPLDPDPDLATTEAVRSFYFYGYQWEEADADRFVKCPQTLVQWAEYFSGEERFKFWLTPEGAASTPAASYTPPATVASGWAGDKSDPMGEFAAPTTHNPPETANQPVSAVPPPTGTSFSSFKEGILHKAKEGQK